MRALTCLLLAMLALVLPRVAGAFDVEEFDAGWGEWEFSPQKIGRSTTDGWAIVRNDGELAARNTKTGTKYTYYWKLTRDFDLRTAANPRLDLRLQFKGHNYDYAAVQVGPKGASRLSDFTTLQRWDTAMAAPEEHLLDLSGWAGQEVVVRVIMRKPYGLTESKIGLYVHRIGVVVDPAVTEVPTTPEVLNVGAFNVQIFGITKMDKPAVVSALTAISQRYDLLLIQEIRDRSETAIYELLDAINDETDDPFEMQLSDRLGRSSSKEQYALLYRSSKLTWLDSYHYDDGVEPDADLFEREPYIVRLQAADGTDFAVVSLHAAPDEAVEEIDFLADVIDDVELRWSESDILILGDLNAGCSYVRASELPDLLLVQDPDVDWWIDDDSDTTTTATDCPYDRILTLGAPSALAVPGSGTPFLFDQALQLSPTATRAVSDHYPVELLLELSTD